MREICTSGLMRGMWKRGLGYRATSLLYLLMDFLVVLTDILMKCASSPRGI